MARRKLTRPITLAGPAVQVHDRRATDFVMGARVAAVEVEDPYGIGGTGRIIVMRSLRDDPLGAMYARNQVDKAQHDAGRDWQKYMEDCEVGNIRAIDPSKEAVDCAQRPDPLSERHTIAFAKLKEAHAVLGMIGENIVRDILGNGLTVMEAAARRGYTTRGEVEFMGRRFREALNTLAVQFGHATSTAK